MAKTAPNVEKSPTATEEEWADSHEYHHESHYQESNGDQGSPAGASAGAGAGADGQGPNYGGDLSPPNWNDVDWHVVSRHNGP